jgi:hypothetical protein
VVEAGGLSRSFIVSGKDGRESPRVVPAASRAKRLGPGRPEGTGRRAIGSTTSTRLPLPMRRMSRLKSAARALSSSSLTV